MSDLAIGLICFAVLITGYILGKAESGIDRDQLHFDLYWEGFTDGVVYRNVSDLSKTDKEGE